MGATLKMKECDTMRILVVEDDRLLNNTLCYNLNTAGYTVDSALTKSVASSFLTKQDYDLIVLDVNLPDGNGFDFCREVKERRPDTAIIFLTANDMESDMLKGYELGAEDYVTKPFPTIPLRTQTGGSAVSSTPRKPPLPRRSSSLSGMRSRTGFGKTRSGAKRWYGNTTRK